MLTKLSIFVGFLLAIGNLIEKNIITTIPQEIYYEFSLVFCFTTMGYFVLRKFMNKM
jgi:hypothetical protein